MIIALPLHMLAVVLWVGGMFFAHQILRPTVGALDGPVRLAQWRRVFARFFPWVGIAVIVLLATGFYMITAKFGGFAHLPLYVNIMMGLGIIMVLAFGHMVSAPWKRFRRAVDGSDWAAAAGQLNQIRGIVTFNLILGIIVVIVAASGDYWG
jgi:uncharacterized membrane protein